MFHIVFNADENYMKYVAVLMTNIVHYTDPMKSYADFVGGNVGESRERERERERDGLRHTRG